MQFQCYCCGKLVDFADAIVVQSRNSFGNTLDWKIYDPTCYEKKKKAEAPKP